MDENLSKNILHLFIQHILVRKDNKPNECIHKRGYRHWAQRTGKESHGLHTVLQACPTCFLELCTPLSFLHLLYVFTQKSPQRTLPWPCYLKYHPHSYFYIYPPCFTFPHCLALFNKLYTLICLIYSNFFHQNTESMRVGIFICFGHCGIHPINIF